MSLIKVQNSAVSSGFTLIELIVSIGIIGILVTILAVLINPVEQMAYSRDISRITTLTELAHAMKRYAVTHNYSYPEPVSWIDELINSSEIKSGPKGISYRGGIIACSANAYPGARPTFCYVVDTSEDDLGILIFTRLESHRKRLHCNLSEPYFVYSSQDDRIGEICSASEPAPWATGTQTYYTSN